MWENTEVNLHTHTPLCHHAVSTIPEFCRAAAEGGFKVLGFSDHAPHPDDRVFGYHMLKTELPAYGRMLDEASEIFPGLVILRGLELDFRPDMIRYLEFKEELHLDYLLGSAHRVFCGDREVFFIEKSIFDEKVMLAFFEADLAMLRSGVVDMIAHPDAAASRYPGKFTDAMVRLTREMAREAKALDIPLEINVNGTGGICADPGRWRYPWEPFWEIVAEEDAPVVIGIDAHAAAHLVSSRLQPVWNFAERLGIRVQNAAVAEKLISRRPSK